MAQIATSGTQPAASIDERTWYVDTDFMGAAHYIATGVLETSAGLVLVDPGPTTVLDGLKAGLAARGASLDDVVALLLTHIHLDHAGATGTIAAACPDADVYVHRVGAPHVADPSRLLESARRLYGDQMDVLWGEVKPVPEERVHAVTNGDVLSFETGDGGERRIRVAYTPGHASHHVSYLDEASGTAFVGDTAGQRTAGVDYAWPVTPPPDVDLEAWHDSLDTLRAWEADRLFCTHFGPHDDPADHLDRMDERLRQWGQDARALLYDDDHQHESDEARADAFDAEKIEAMRAAVPEEDRTPYENFGRPRESWHGLARYWRTHGEGDAA